MGCSVKAEVNARPPSEMMVRFIDAHRDVDGGEPICAVPPIAPSGYYEPAGVGHGLRPPRDLEPGDVVEMGITGLGAQRHVIVAPETVRRR